MAFKAKCAGSFPRETDGVTAVPFTNPSIQAAHCATVKRERRENALSIGGNRRPSRRRIVIQSGQDVQSRTSHALRILHAQRGHAKVPKAVVRANLLERMCPVDALDLGLVCS